MCNFVFLLAALHLSGTRQNTDWTFSMSFMPYGQYQSFKIMSVVALCSDVIARFSMPHVDTSGKEH